MNGDHGYIMMFLLKNASIFNDHGYHSRLYQLLDEFEQLTACPVLINTSFNVRGEPIVHTPEDAYRCIMRTGTDYLVMENILLDKTEQPISEKDDSWQSEFALD